MHSRSFAALAPGAHLEPYDYPMAELGPRQVDICVEFCGVSHTDVENIDNLHGRGVYPMVPGHEVVGRVQRLGRDVQSLRVGQRVGVGWQAGSCFECDWCKAGMEHLCQQQTATCWKNCGGFSERIQVDHRFAFPIPDSLPSAQTAPLLCAGVTVYAPFFDGFVQAGMRLGVVGFGGLGHLAVQFGRAWGCEVIVLSRSADKRPDAMALGADDFVVTGPQRFEPSLQRSLDLIVVTSSAALDWSAYLDLLKPRGTFYLVGVVPGDLCVPARRLLSGNLRVMGSNIGSRAAIGAMLDFAAQHAIRARAEVMPLSHANAAIDRVRQGRARYRVVLQNDLDGAQNDFT